MFHFPTSRAIGLRDDFHSDQAKACFNISDFPRENHFLERDLPDANSTGLIEDDL